MFVLLLLFICSMYKCEEIRRRFEYKHSFRAPDLIDPTGKIIFWEVSGDAIASSDRLRLAPSMQSKRGIAWNTKPMVEGEFWEVEISLQVTGPGRIGADGLAVWYTDTKGRIGSVFGANDYWRGLGVFFDTFDNNGQGDNPAILVLVNDGTKSFDHSKDGGSEVLGSCKGDFRNRPVPVKAKIQYHKNTVTVFVTNGLSFESQYELCCTVSGVVLPKNGYFGLSAATGGIGDDHDVVSFSTYSIVSPELPPVF
ncbi:unnamed protein product [Soboliphyme baturini]|uniref:L-type lectin-like domain-containing protein n=1 Tax=Soboliphyme baturini TaxID=241478 RepID=A0A183IC38_9BILA|nr:unnamed protein product [Soboliphyme baturini]